MSVAVVMLSVLTEGPLARAELQIDRGPAADAALEEAMVERLGAALRADPRVRAGGLRVDAGCSSRRCLVALDGLAPALNEALPAFARLAGAPPSLSALQKRAARRRWRFAARSPATVMEAALEAAAGRPAPRPRPRLDTASQARVWAGLGHRAHELAVATPLVAEAGPPAGEVAQLLSALPPPPAPARTAERAPFVLPSPEGVTRLVVDWPGASRAQVGLQWPTTPDDAVRDALIAGDFESRLVQRLRERDALTYDISPVWGEGTAGAVFDVSPARAPAALAAAESELATPPTAEELRAAALRLRARRAALADSLAGRLAERTLPPLPAPGAGAALPAVYQTVLVGDADALVIPDATVLDRCLVVYGTRCPD